MSEGPALRRRTTAVGALTLAGARRLLGDWFPGAYAEDERRAFGIAFESVADRQAFRPEERLRYAKLGEATPPGSRSASSTGARTSGCRPRRSTASSPPCRGRRPGRTTRASCAASRRGALRACPARCSIEIFAPLTPRTPAFVCGYVTATTVLVRAEQPDELDAYAAELNDLMLRGGRDQPPPFPDAAPHVAVDLTTHAGHFVGRGRNRLLLVEHDGQAYLRAAGRWDEMPASLEQAYRMVGRHAPQAVWGNRRPETNMLHQIAMRTAPR